MTGANQLTNSLALCARIAHHGLIAAECAALTGAVPDSDGVAQNARTDDVGRGAYVQRGLRVVARADSLGELVDAVRTTAIDADRFRVDVHDPSNRLGRDSTDVAIELADVINYGPDLRNPLHRFLVVATANDIAFAEVTGAADSSYRLHESKPWTTSSSIDPRLSRGLVNLAPDATSILDPCCGAGSIVLEAASLGLDATGVDWKPAMAGMTRENLAHFGYSARVEQADFRDLDVRADAVVTDLPYGQAIDADDNVTRTILERSAASAPIGVFVAPRQISREMNDAGFVDIDVHTVLKRRGFIRWIHVGTSTVVDA